MYSSYGPVQSLIGEIMILEPDELARDQCLRAIPAEFRNRITICTMPNFPVGLYGAAIPEVQAHRESWARDVRESTSRWCDALKANSDHGVLLVLLSSGGSAALGEDAIHAYKREWQHNRVYVVTLMDEKTSVRCRFADMVGLYDAVADGFIVSDNRRKAEVADMAVCLLVGATPAATFISDRRNDVWNVFAHVFAQHRFATVSLWTSSLPVYWHRVWLQTVPVTTKHRVQESIKSIVHAVAENPVLQSVPAPGAPGGNTRFVIVAEPIVPQDLRDCAKRATEDLEEWRADFDQDLIVEVAPIAVDVNRKTVTVPAIGVLLTPLADDAAGLGALATGARPIDPAFLSGGVLAPVRQGTHRLAAATPSAENVNPPGADDAAEEAAR